MSDYVIEIPQSRWPVDLLNTNSLPSNGKARGRLIYPWRRLGSLMAQDHGLPTPINQPVLIRAEFRLSSNRRRDTGNLYPTIKALVDGLVDARVLPDDCDGIVEGPHLVRTYPNGTPRIRLFLVPLAPGEVGRERTFQVSDGQN